MAKTPTTLVGLELDPSGIHVAAVSTKSGLEITHALSVALEPGIVRDGEVADVEGLSAALRELWRDEKDLDRRVRIGIANQKIVVRVLELPPISDPKELAQAVLFQAQDEIPMPLESAVLDHQVLDIVTTEAGPRQRVVLVAARRDMVDKVLAAVRGAGLRPEAIDLSAFGMVRALHGSALADGATETDPVLYLGVGGLTNLAVAEGTTCRFTRVVGGGLESIVAELAERRQLTLEHARGWLTHVGLETPLDTIEGEPELVSDTRLCLDEGVRRIASEVRNSLDFHQARADTVTLATRCVLTGPASAIPGFAPALGTELGLPVIVGSVRGAPSGLEPSVSVAAGLAVQEAVAA